VTPVRIGSEIYGDSAALVTSVTDRWITAEIYHPPPLRSVVVVDFTGMVARAEVVRLYRLQASDGVWAGIGLRVLEWLDSI
jgi:hypothetical protein